MFVHIDSGRIVNLYHVASVFFAPKHKAVRQVYSDIDGQEHPAGYLEPDTLELVLVFPSDSGYNSSEGMRIKVTDQNARDLWEYFDSRADIPSLEREARNG